MIDFYHQYRLFSRRHGWDSEFQSFLSGDIGPLNECLLSIGASPLSVTSVILDAQQSNLSMLQSERIFKICSQFNIIIPMSQMFN